jgi:hypothetical protein
MEALIHKLVKNKMEAFHVYKLINLYGDGSVLQKIIMNLNHQL